MDDVETISVSKGCFVVPGVSSQPCSLQASDYLMNDDGKSTLRWKLGQKIWNNIEASVKKLHVELQENIFADMIEFINKSYDSKHNKGTEKKAEIPSAALITGVNMPDHPSLFTSLKEKIKEDSSNHVVILQAKHCSTMKSLMRSVGDQLMLEKGYRSVESESEEETDSTDQFLFMKKKSTSLTVSMIVKWYNQIVSLSSRTHSPKKKIKLSNSLKKPPVVIMFQDLEGFSQAILRDFIITCSFHTRHLPVVFVFGVATSWLDVSQRLLPHSALIHLSVQKFTSPPASAHLALIIDEILLTSEHPFKLSGRCMQSLLDVFLCHDFSITNFMHMLKFCVLEHFYKTPASMLCACDVDSAINTVSKLNKLKLRELYGLDSVQRFISSMDQAKRLSLKKESVFKENLVHMIREIHHYHAVFFPVLRSLHAFTGSLPNYPLGKQIREIYIACSRYELSAYEGFKQAFTLLKVSSRDQLIERLQSCVTTLELSSDEDNTDKECSLRSACKKINYFIKELAHMGEKELCKNDSEEEEEPNSLETVKYTYQLQERLRNRASQKKIRKMTKFEKVREESLNYMKAFYEYNLRRVHALPLHESFYFDSVNAVKRHLRAAPRLAVQTALSNPHHYLKVPSLEVMVDGLIPGNAPDICIAYKLHNESGNIINLFDWMTAFHTIVTSLSEDNDAEEQRSEIDDVTQARFIKAVAELQLLGFIKPTKKKTDHVQRLTWSHI